MTQKILTISTPEAVVLSHSEPSRVARTVHEGQIQFARLLCPPYHRLRLAGLAKVGFVKLSSFSVGRPLARAWWGRPVGRRRPRPPLVSPVERFRPTRPVWFWSRSHGGVKLATSSVVVLLRTCAGDQQDTQTKGRMMDHGRMAVEASQPKPGAGQKGTMAKRGRGGEFPVSFLKGDEHRSPLLSSSSPSHMLLYRLAHPSLSHVFLPSWPCRYLNFEPGAEHCAHAYVGNGGRRAGRRASKGGQKSPRGAAFCRRGHARWQENTA
jgi:hypothetical protein